MRISRAGPVILGSGPVDTARPDGPQDAFLCSFAPTRASSAWERRTRGAQLHADMHERLLPAFPVEPCPITATAPG
jgi:hypothetical protein